MLICKDSVVEDKNTGLMWLRFAYGQTWVQGQVNGTIQRIVWVDAFKEAQKINSNTELNAGYTDWRLPTIDELRTLIIGGKKPAIDTDVFPDGNYEFAWYWSSSVHKDGVRVIDFWQKRGSNFQPAKAKQDENILDETKICTVRFVRNL